jgi:hypothetical protein
VCSFGACSWHQAGTDSAFIHNNGTSTTLSGIATDFGTRQVKLFAQYLGKAIVATSRNTACSSIDSYLHIAPDHIHLVFLALADSGALLLLRKMTILCASS